MSGARPSQRIEWIALDRITVVNSRIVRHLARYHADILAEFQKIADLQKAA